MAPVREPPPMDPAVKELLTEARSAAKLGGASFADARIGRYRNNFVITREQQIVNVVDTDTIGVGVRVLVNGTWVFGASRDLTKSGVVAATEEAVAIAKANSRPNCSASRGRARVCRWDAKCGSKAGCSSSSRTRGSGRGLTRDGTFLIENGQVTKAVKNLRFNESPLFMLNNLEMLGGAERVAGTESGGNVVFPTIKVKDSTLRLCRTRCNKGRSAPREPELPGCLFLASYSMMPQCAATISNKRLETSDSN